MNYGQLCVAGPSRIVARHPSNALRHASTATAKAKAKATPAGGVGRYAAFLPTTHPKAAHKDRTPHLIMKAAAKGNSPTWGWKPAPDRGIKEGDTLRQMARQDVPQPSTAQLEFDQAGAANMDEYGDGSLDVDSLTAVPLGSLLELRRDGLEVLACLMGYSIIPLNGVPVLRSMTPSGAVITHNLHDIYFTVPSYFPTSLVEAGGQSDKPTSKAEENSRLAIMRRLLELAKDVEKTRALIKGKATMLYNFFRSSDPEGWSVVSVTDAARYIDGTDPDKSPSTRTIFAIHKYMCADSVRFQMDPTRHRVSQTFMLRPWRDVEALIMADSWARTDDPIIPQFIAKAKSIVEASRSLRRAGGSPEPMLASHLPQFDDNDMKIIRTLQISAERSRFVQDDPTTLVGQTIIRDMRLITGNKDLYQYDATVEHRRGVSEFLTDLGVNTPWKDLSENRLVLPRRTEEQRRTFDEDGERMYKLWEEQRGQMSGTKMSTSPPSPKELNPVDDCEHVRHDFGDLAVFVIDDPNAEELDDGISVEPIEGSEDMRIHIHIADPTRLIHPENVFAREARNRGETVYLVEQTVPMLPKPLVKAEMTLTPGKPLYTLSFSARVDTTGALSELDVRAGLVNNVRRATYAQVNSLLGHPATPNPHILDLLSADPAANAVNVRQETKHLPTAIVKQLAEVARRMRTFRTAREWFSQYNLRSSVSLVDGTLPENPRVPQAPSLWHGFPKVNVLLGNRASDAATDIVSEFMLAAGRIAGKWAHERGIPLIYRGTEPCIAQDPAAVAQILSLRDDHNLVSETVIHRYNVSIPGAQSSIRPLRHFLMGISASDGGYTRVTSPLRRFVDLACHWQLKSAIRSPSLKNLAFSPEEMEFIAVEQHYRGRMIGKQDKANWKLWMHRLVALAVYTDAFPEAGEILRTSFPALVNSWPRKTHTRMADVDLLLPDLGTMGYLTVLRAKQEDFVPGTPINVRVKEVEVSSTPRVVCELATSQP